MSRPLLALTGTALREQARRYLNQVPPLGQEIHSGPNGVDEPTDPLFYQLTWMTHKSLRDAWAAKRNLTCCNAFVGIYAQTLGLYFEWGNLGRFDLAKVLPAVNRGIAWIPASTGTLPCYGDIFIQTQPPSTEHPNGILHQGVSLDFGDDGTWNTAEGGQGGKSKGFDIIKRKNDNLLSAGVIGWVDINLYAQCTRQTSPVPDWLVGHWDVSWRGQMWYYHFGKNREVTYTQHEELRKKLPFVAEGKGRFAVNEPNGVITRWTKTGTGEQFERAAGAPDLLMYGWVNGMEAIAAKKFENPGPFGAFG